MRFLRTHLPQLIRTRRTQPRRQKPGTDTPHLHAVVLQDPIPIQHHHVQRGLGAPVRDECRRLRLRPAGWRVEVSWRVGVGGAGEGAEPGRDEHEAWVGGGEEERYEGRGHDVGAGDVDVVAGVPTLAHGELARGDRGVGSPAYREVVNLSGHGSIHRSFVIPPLRHWPHYLRACPFLGLESK